MSEVPAEAKREEKEEEKDNVREEQKEVDKQGSGKKKGLGAVKLLHGFACLEGKDETTQVRSVVRDIRSVLKEELQHRPGEVQDVVKVWSKLP